MTTINVSNQELETKILEVGSLLGKSSKLVNSDSDLEVCANEIKTGLAHVSDLLKANYPRCDLRKKMIRAVEKSFNQVDSGVELLLEKEISTVNFYTMVAENLTRLQKVKSHIEKLSEERSRIEKKQREKAGIFDGYSTKNYDIKQSPVSKALDVIDKSAHLISMYANYSRELPATEVEANKLGAYIITRMPILPITNPMVYAEDFEKVGFTTKKLGYYAVLENQIIIGIHAKKAKEMNKTTEEFFDIVKTTVQRQMGIVLDTIGNPTGYKNSGYTYFWLVPERSIDALRTKVQKPLNVKNWHFAFR